MAGSIYIDENVMFFESLPEGVRVVRMDTPRGELLLILGKMRWGIPEIYGLKGFGS